MEPGKIEVSASEERGDSRSIRKKKSVKVKEDNAITASLLVLFSRWKSESSNRLESNASSSFISVLPQSVRALLRWRHRNGRDKHVATHVSQEELAPHVMDKAIFRSIANPRNWRCTLVIFVSDGHTISHRRAKQTECDTTSAL